jgi:hypothetical protein
MSANDRVWWVRLWQHWHYKRCLDCKAWLTMNYCIQERPIYKDRVERCRACEQEHEMRKGQEFYRRTGRLPI